MKTAWLLILFALLSSSFAEAQQAGKVPRIGFLDPTSRAVSKARIESFRQGLVKLGYKEGKNIAIDYRFADGESERLNEHAAELIRLNVDIIVTRAIPGAVAAQHATIKTPIVFVGVADAVAAGLVASLAKPGGNITGLTNFGVQLIAKRMEYLKEAIPRLSRVAVLVNPNAQSSRQSFEDSQAAAEKLQLTIQRFEAQTLADLESIFDAMIKARMQAVSLTPDGLFFQFRTVIGRLMLARTK